MSETDYKKNVVIAIICDVVSLFIFGYVFSSIAYYLFDKNYKNSLNSRNKRNNSILGKAFSSLLFAFSITSHSLRIKNPLDYTIEVSIVTAVIVAVICVIVLKQRDKKIPCEDDDYVENVTFSCGNCGATIDESDDECPNCGASFKEDDSEELFKCDNCGAMVPENASECPNCGELFDDEESDDDLNILYDNAEKNKKTNKTKSRDLFLKYISKTEKIMKSKGEKCYTFGNCVEFSIAANNGELEDEKCLDINYKTSDAYLNLAIISFDEKDYDNAIKILNKSLKLNPCNISSLFEMAENYKAKGELLKYLNWTNKCYEKIYYVNHLAHYYRNLGYYYIEKKEWNLAKALYLYSLKYDANPVVTTELQYIIQKTNDKSLPSKESLTSILRKNEIPTFIKKDNLNLIKDIYNGLEKDNKLESNVGKFITNLMKENSNTKD